VAVLACERGWLGAGPQAVLSKRGEPRTQSVGGSATQGWFGVGNEVLFRLRVFKSARLGGPPAGGNPNLSLVLTKLTTRALSLRIKEKKCLKKERRIGSRPAESRLSTSLVGLLT